MYNCFRYLIYINGDIMKKRSILYNLSILVSTGLIVKLLGMLNKIIITRILGIDGISMYSLMMPSVMLLLGVCSFSLSTSIQNIVSQNISKTSYSNRDLIIKSFIVSTLLCSTISLITLIFNYFICHNLLKMDTLQRPFIFFIPMYFFASYGGVLKGYFHGHNKLNIYAFAQGIEQIIRITFSIIILLFANNLSLEYCLILIVLSMGIGEFFQFLFLAIYCLFFTKIKSKSKVKYKYSDFTKTSATITLNRLISSIAYFFEPIIFTYAIGITGIGSNVASKYFGILHGYVIPLIITGSFVTTAIQQSILPSLSMNKEDTNKINHIISKSLFLSFIPGILVFYIFYFHSSEILNFIYKENIGSSYLKLMSISTFISYFDGVFGAIIIVYSYERKMLFYNIITSIFKLLLIFILVQLPFINAFGLPLSYAIISILHSLFTYILMIKKTNYKPKYSNLFYGFICIVIILLIGAICDTNNIYWIISISISTFVTSIIGLILYKQLFSNRLNPI